MTATTEPIQFVNADGCKLYGIVHLPEEPRRRHTAILLLSPGVKMRVAPHQLYRKMADVFVTLGYPVLRFDFHGLGDSEGEVKEDLLADLYGSIQVGRYVDDTRHAMAWITESYGIDRYVLAGLCGGAITGLLTARSDDRVRGLLGLGIPVILDGANIDTSKFLTEGQLEQLHQGYVRRFLKPKSWFRLLTLRSDYRVIFKVLKRKLFHSEAEILKVSEADIKRADAPPEDNANPQFAPAFFEMLSKEQRILLIFSGSDRLGWEFEEKFVIRHRARLKQFRDRYEVATIPEANHIFTLPAWQEQMFELSKKWLLSNFPD